jgi:hypothetical protein
MTHILSQMTLGKWFYINFKKTNIGNKQATGTNPNLILGVICSILFVTKRHGLEARGWQGISYQAIES